MSLIDFFLKDKTKKPKKTDPKLSVDDNNHHDTVYDDEENNEDSSDPLDRGEPRRSEKTNIEQTPSALSWSAAISKANLLQITNTGLAVALLIMAFLVFNQKPTIIVKPPIIAGDLVIKDGLPSSGWKISWAIFFADLIGNINPRNVGFATKSISTFLAPELREEQDTALRGIAEEMRVRGIEQQFVIDNAAPDDSDDVIRVWGYKTTNILAQSNDGSLQPDRRKWTFEFKLKMNELGQPQIIYVDQYEGSSSSSSTGKKKNSKGAHK